jgi:hypothetical protein
MARIASRHELGWRSLQTPSENTDGDIVAMGRHIVGYLLLLAIVAGLGWWALDLIVQGRA